FTPARPGNTLETTIDRSLQYATTQALSGEITSSHAKGGIAVVMDPKTGDILSMVNMVAGATPGAPPVEASSNQALTNVYEPGSVAKITTLSGAIQDHVISPTQHFVVPYSMNVGGALFTDAEVHPTQSMSVSDILAQSSNVGTITIAKLLGKDRINHYLKAFGLGQPTGLNFPGESQGLLIDPAHWSGTAIGSVPIGQDEAVTAVQMLDAYNTLANGGMFVAPRLVRAVVDGNGSVHPLAAATPHRVVDASVAQDLTGMLEQVVKSGTGTRAAIPGYLVAGKTGTAQIPKTNGPGYQPGAFMATFAGFAPAQNPALSAIMILNQPRQDYGGTVAAPLFAQVVQYGLRLFNVPPPGA
ncbi:MAG: peptidoglycan D,D-transpeptidase FtsI family protein, partial [Acidimicrobiales bacterium]